MPIQRDLTLRAAETPNDIARLRAFIARHGAEAAHTLDRHLARPRYRAQFTPIAERAGAALALEDTRGRVEAYATIEEHPSAAALSVDEAAAADAGAARGLIMALRACAHEHGVRRLSLELSPWHLAAQAVAHLHGDI